VVLVSNKRLRIFSFKPTFLGALFLLSLFIQIVPGTILVSFFDYPMSFGVDTTISNEVKIETFRYTFISISALLFIITAASVFLNFDVDVIKLETRYLRAKLLTFFSLVVILVKILSVGNIPFLMVLHGDFEGAALAKAQILKNEVGFGGLFIGYIFVYFPYISLVYAYCQKKKQQYGIGVFRLNLLLITIYSIYDMQKSKFIVVLFILFILYLKF
ncbi:O70 family O-antigen polymerase, partial [Escherichia coli]|nr:O70 family O-antigen polymerase [Escherichia coli]